MSPDLNENVATSNIPHVMYYAPNVSDRQVGAATPTSEQLGYYSQHGRWSTTPDPFVILHGPHAYIVQFAGVTERDAMTKEYAAMLARLCAVREAWCLPR